MSSPTYHKGVHRLADGVYAYLQPDGRWGYSNAGFVVGQESTLLVDTLFTVDLTDQMLSELRVSDSRAGHIDYVVNTHANGDHCYGNQLVASSVIIASEASATEVDRDDPRWLQGALDQASELGELGEYFSFAFGDFDFRDVVITAPTKRFSGAMTVELGGRSVELLEVGPAHTAGDVIVHVADASTVFAGDILFIDGTPIMWAGPVANWISACQLIEDLEPEFVVPGHGPVTTIAGVRAVRSYLEFFRDHSVDYHARGMDPWTATLEIKLGAFEKWLDPERIALNVAMMYHEIDSENFSAPTALEGFSLMARYRALRNET